MNYNQEYFFLIHANGFPFLRTKDADLDRSLMGYKHREQPEEPYDLYFREPVPVGMQKGDLHMLSGIRHVFSKRIKESIENLNPAKTGFLPADLHGNSGYEEDYFIFNPYNIIECMDLEKSQYITSSRGNVLSIDKLVIDPKKLQGIPENERLVIVLGESKTYTLFHQRVIDSIAKFDPVGMHAVAVEAWDANINFLLP